MNKKILFDYLASIKSKQMLSLFLYFVAIILAMVVVVAAGSSYLLSNPEIVAPTVSIISSLWVLFLFFGGFHYYHTSITNKKMFGFTSDIFGVVEKFKIVGLMLLLSLVLVVATKIGVNLNQKAIEVAQELINLNVELSTVETGVATEIMDKFVMENMHVILSTKVKATIISLLFLFMWVMVVSQVAIASMLTRGDGLIKSIKNSVILSAKSIPVIISFFALLFFVVSVVESIKVTEPFIVGTLEIFKNALIMTLMFSFAYSILRVGVGFEELKTKDGEEIADNLDSVGADNESTEGVVEEFVGDVEDPQKQNS